ncbi:hypothetical protein GQ457_02G043500 [Hibiscus cannabinus]
MPNDGTNLLEVPGNRLPETGSNMAEFKKRKNKEPGNRFYARSDQPGRIKLQQYCEVVLKQRPRNHQGRISAQTFQPWPKDKYRRGY